MSKNKKKLSKDSSKTAGKSSSLPLNKRLAAWWQDQSVALRFLGLFALLIGVFYSFYFSKFNILHVHPHVLNAQAKVGAFLLRLMGQPVRVEDQYISGDGFSMSVSGGCDGLEVTALLIAGVLAFPSTWREKWKGLLFGVGVLTVLNILRLPVLYIAGAKGSTGLFNFLHIQGGFVIFISITMLLWGYWVIRVLNQRKLDSSQA